MGYVRVNLQIPGIRGYNEDVLLLVILTMTYSEKVPVMVGSKIIDRAMGMTTKGELVRATMIGYYFTFQNNIQWTAHISYY